MHTGLLDVLHDRPDPGPRAVADRVHVDLDRVLDEAVERQHGLLDRDVLQRRVLGRQVQVGQLLAEHQPAGHLGQRDADRLGDEGHGPRGPRVGLDHVQLAALDRELHVEQPDDAEAHRDAGGLLADAVEHLRAERVRRQDAGAVAGVDAGLLDVLHDARDPDFTSPSCGCAAIA